MATIAPNLKGDIDEEYDDSQLDSDEEADRVRKMQGEGKVIINNEAGLLEKLNELKKGFDEGILNRMPPGNKKKNVSWLERLDTTSDKKVEIVASEVTDDIQREVSFFNIAIENTKNALNKLKGMNQKLVRPNDYLVEMYKADEVMQKIKSNLVRQQVKIQNFEERKLRRDNKKFAKKVQQVKLLEKQKEKRRNLDAIDKWKQEIKQKGENAADLSSFLKNDPGKKRFGGPTGGRKNLAGAGRGGHGGRGGRGGSNSKGAQQIPRGGKKITKRPGKNQRTNMRNSQGSRGGRGGSRGGSRGGRGGSRGGRGGRR